MSPAVFIQPAAERDLASAHDWYLKESDALATRFEVDAATRLHCAEPSDVSVRAR